jgi:hypothetical protein
MKRINMEKITFLVTFSRPNELKTPHVAGGHWTVDGDIVFNIELVRIVSRTADQLN